MTDPNHQLGDIVNGHRLTEQPDGSLAWLPVNADPTPVTPQEHKPGDIVNGHQLTEQPDGSMVWQPLVTQPPKKKSKLWLWLPLGVVGGVLLLIIVIGSIYNATSGDNTASGSSSSASDDDELTPGQQAERDAAEEEPEPEPEPAPPAPELGTLENPAPVGTPISSESWDGTTYDTVVVEKVDPANDMVAQENQFNDAAAPDHRYIVLGFTLTNTTSDASKPVNPSSAVYDISIVDAATGQSYPQVSTVLPNNITMQNDIYAGQSATGQVAYMVPNSATQLLIGSGGVFVALQ